MIYLTNDSCDQGVYFDIRRSDRKAGSGEILCHGLLGNGVCELPVTVRSRRGWVDIDLGGGELFRFVEEHVIRQMLGDVVREMVCH